MSPCVSFPGSESGSGYNPAIWDHLTKLDQDMDLIKAPWSPVYYSIFFAQGEAAQPYLEALEESYDSALMMILDEEHLPKRWNDQDKPWSENDSVWSSDGEGSRTYHLSWNDRLGYIGLCYSVE